MYLNLEQTNGFNYSIDYPPKTWRKFEGGWWILNLVDDNGCSIKQREGRSRDSVLGNFLHELETFQAHAPENKKADYATQILLVKAKMEE